MNSLRTDGLDGTDASVPVLRKPVTAGELVTLLRSQLGSLSLSRVRRNDRSMAIRRLESYLAQVPHEPLAVDEQLLSGLEDWLVGDDEGSRRYHRKTPSHIRSLVNSLPDDLRNRQLLTNRQVRGTDRFGGFDPATALLLERFLKDGRIARCADGRTEVTPKLLAASVREKAVYAAAKLLRDLGIAGIAEVGADDIDRFLATYPEDERYAAVHTVSNMKPLFRWLAAVGGIPRDPLAGFESEKRRPDFDYVPADQIAKLADLATLDPSSFADVRDRLVAFVLCYDFALRLGEAVRLRLDDVHVNAFMEVTLRGEIQKGAKTQVTLRNLFPESRTLFEAYLRLREPLAGDAGALLVSETGKPLLVTGCGDAVRRVSDSLGIRTHGGRTPSPHRYRHSLGTLNVGELGMKLSPYYLMRRYRHNDLRTTMDVYVAHNPLLDEAQHMAVVAAARGNGNGHAEGGDAAPKAMASDITVREVEAMRRVRSLGINWRSLREHAMGERAAVERGGRFYYSRAYLDRMCTGWMTRDEAMRLMGVSSPTAFHNRVRNHGIKTLVIGRASLAKTDDVVRSLRSANAGIN